MAQKHDDLINEIKAEVDVLTALAVPQNMEDVMQLIEEIRTQKRLLTKAKQHKARAEMTDEQILSVKAALFSKLSSDIRSGVEAKFIARFREVMEQRHTLFVGKKEEAKVKSTALKSKLNKGK